MDTNYNKQIEKWRAKMDSDIRKENSWLALAGLFWLEEGANTIGSDASNTIILPKRAHARLGSIDFDGQIVTLNIEAGNDVQINGKQATRSVLEADKLFTLDGLQMVVIQRDAGTAIRLWDNEREERRSYPARTWYPINELFRMPANYTPYAEPKTVSQSDTFGSTIVGQVDGYVTFKFEGQTHTLDAMQAENGHLDIPIRDKTSRDGTYPSGRFYYTQEPVVDGHIMLDFNYAYNPPCAMTPFATCIFAPTQNTLPFRVEAGETYSQQQ